MKNNLQIITQTVDYIEAHLEEDLNLNSLARDAGYSKYHLHKMFTCVTGFPIHFYVQRRRLTEAARMLVFSNQSIMEIALISGYETQQSFSVAFKAMFDCSPQAFRKKRDFYPLQLKFTVDGKKELRGDMMMDVKTIEFGEILLVGYKANTQNGFSVIGDCWEKLRTARDEIQNCTDQNFLIALNDYSINFSYENEQPGFDYYAAAEVSDISEIPKGMETRKLPASKYAVFTFSGKQHETLQPIVEYVYREWFPKSTCRLNENAMYDLARYSDPYDEKGNSTVEFWVPVL